MAEACESFRSLLSAYVDSEVSAKQRGQVELHLSGCADCRARLADLRVLSEAVTGRLEARLSEVDFSGFADQVLKRIGPERPGLLERLQVIWSELISYHRTAVISSLATAAITLAVAVPVAYKLAASRAAQPTIVLRDLKLDDPSIQPVVMSLGDGKTLIMLVRPSGASEGEAAPLELDKEPPTGGDL